MNLMQISFAVLSFGMMLGFLVVAFSILFQTMERNISAKSPPALHISRKLPRCAPWALLPSTVQQYSFYWVL